MKTKHYSKKLLLNKKTISNIGDDIMLRVHAGNEETYGVTLCKLSDCVQCVAISDAGFTCDTVETYCRF